MAIKELHIEGIGDVRFQKRRGTRSVRISIQGHSVRVTQPSWISYAEAVRFVKSRADWIKKHKTNRDVLAHSALIGKTYQLSVAHAPVQKPATRLKGGIIQVTLPPTLDIDSTAAQTVIERACERALAKEAKELLTPRLQDLAYEYNFRYTSLSFKKLKRRWGSCDSQKNIVLNIFLTQMPWEYIDYVILHELTHTQHLHHGPAFWQKLTECMPEAKRLRKEIHQFHPQLMPH
jgi:hypothetical protein